MLSRSALLISLFLLLVGIGLIYFFSGAQMGAQQFNTQQVILFSSTGCSDCHNIERLLQERQIQFFVKTVETPLAQAELQQTLAQCQLSQSQGINLPLLFINSTCLSGTDVIVEYLRQQ